MKNTIQDKIYEFVRNHLLVSHDSFNMQYDDDLFAFGLDSLKLMKLIHFIEDEFQVVIPYEKVNTTYLRSINTIAHLLEQLKKDKGHD